MVAKSKRIDEQKMFKIGRLNLQVKSKDWYNKLVITLADWPCMKVAMPLKYNTMDKEEIRAKLEQIK